jgi:hypothetical protein
MVLARWTGSSIVSVTTPASSCVHSIMPPFMQGASR